MTLYMLYTICHFKSVAVTHIYLFLYFIQGDAEIEELPEDFNLRFIDMEQLEILGAENLKKLPPLSGLEALKVLTVSGSKITTLPKDIGDCPQLQV